MNKNKETFFMLLVAFFVILTYFHDSVKDVVESPFGDFAHYYISSYALRGGYNVYKWDRETEEMVNKIYQEKNVYGIIDRPLHSPGFFIFILPLAYLPYKWALFLWWGLSHLFLFFSFILILKITKDKPILFDYLSGIFLVFAFWPIREQLHLGQPSLLALLLLVLSLFFLKKEMPIYAGFILSLGIQTREYLGLIAILFLWKKMWHVLLGFIFGFFLLKAFAIHLFGWETELAYWKHMFNEFGRNIHFAPTNLTLTASLVRLGKDGLGTKIAYFLAWVAVTIFAGLAFYLTKNKRQCLPLEFALFCVLPFLCATWAHESHYVVLYLPILVAWFSLKPEIKASRWALFIISYLLLGLKYSVVRFSRFHSGPLAIFAAGKTIGVILLFFLIGYLLKDKDFNR